MLAGPRGVAVELVPAPAAAAQHGSNLEGRSVVIDDDQPSSDLQAAIGEAAHKRRLGTFLRGPIVQAVLEGAGGAAADDLRDGIRGRLVGSDPRTGADVEDVGRPRTHSVACRHRALSKVTVMSRPG